MPACVCVGVPAITAVPAGLEPPKATETPKAVGVGKAVLATVMVVPVSAADQSASASISPCSEVAIAVRSVEVIERSNRSVPRKIVHVSPAAACLRG